MVPIGGLKGLGLEVKQFLTNLAILRGWHFVPNNCNDKGLFMVERTMIPH